MRSDIPAPADSTLTNRSGLTVQVFPSASPADLLLGRETGGIDLTPFVVSLTQSDTGANARLAVRADQLTGGSRPAAGMSVAISLGSARLFNGLIESVADRVIRPNERSIALTIRRRDGGPLWRETRRMTEAYSVGTDLGEMVRAFLGAMGLEADEYAIPSVGLTTPHDLTQFADLNAWDILTKMTAPALAEPFVDAIGRVRLISRDLNRPPALALSAAQIVEVNSSTGQPPLSTFRVKWLDPALSKVTEQDRCIASQSVTCGFFKQSTSLMLWWSDDHTLRAENTRLVIKQSINDGLIPVGSEYFQQTTPFCGRLKLDMSGWYYAALAAEIGAWYAAHLIPDDVAVAATIPVGRLAEGVAQSLVTFTLMHVGFGQYEIHGTPYDFVHTLNSVEAYNESAPAWVQKVEELETNLCADEAAASALAIGELIFRTKAAAPLRLTIADDLRIEPGDILAMPDGSRFYVTAYERDLSRGAQALLSLEGFAA